MKEAKSAFAKALRLEKNQHPEDAFEAFQAAARLEPRNVSYVTARELCRQQLVFDALQRGNASLLGGRQMEALADFRNAEQLDPTNEFARERERDALGDALPKTAAEPRLLEASAQLRVTPNPVRADFHYRGDGRSLLTAVAQAFGVTASFDDSVVARPVRFDITDVDFYTAMSAAGEVTHTFWTPLQEKQILLAEESQENHRKFDRMAMRTFLLPGMTAPADMNNLVTVLRNLFDIKIVTAQPASGTITLRAPDHLLDSATQFIENLDSSRPEVMLDVRVYQISYMLTRNLGLQIPDQFQLFNIPAAALLALAGQNVQSLINQLICERRHQPGKFDGDFGLAGATARPAKLDFQPARGDLWEWPDARGCEPGYGRSAVLPDPELGEDSGTFHPAGFPGQRRELSRGLALSDSQCLVCSHLQQSGNRAGDRE